MHHFLKKAVIASLLLSTYACSSLFDSEPTESTIKESYVRDFEENLKDSRMYSKPITIYGMDFEDFYCYGRNYRCTDQLIEIKKKDLQDLAKQFDKKECRLQQEEGQPNAALCLISVKTPADLVKRYADAPKQQYFKVVLTQQDNTWKIYEIAKTDQQAL